MSTKAETFAAKHQGKSRLAIMSLASRACDYQLPSCQGYGASERFVFGDHSAIVVTPTAWGIEGPIRFVIGT